MRSKALRQRARPARQRGAALLLLLSVLGLGLATLLINALGNNTQQAARERRTLATLARANDALVGFAATYGRLPRPARSALDGRENLLDCEGEQDCAGFLPWVTLAVDGADSWGKLLRYSVAPGLTRAPVQSGVVMVGKTVRARTPDGKFYYLGGQSVCAPRTPCLPFVLLSSGRNNLGTGVTGVAQANAARGNVDELANQAASAHFIARVSSADPAQPGGEFDDIVTWVPLQRLYQRMRAARNLP
ncbi:MULTISPECIES: hypothetical protein [unclassified Janthinobacterium]|uniref:hypothetical protein n=1 Tax=unclassified Janthinobacterium TaxID=2610881 RepID=UPI00037D90FD|nr:MULTISPECIES: hypothetical protein [unclassified Janthinobacterium]MEC5160287.1 hypothetical protein [Janthinobacterium sp. CG_S6]